VTLLARWDWQGRCNYGDQWAFVKVDLPLDDAVTLVATLSAKFPRADHAAPGYWHEIAVSWHLQDTLNGETWFVLDYGELSSLNPSAAVRLSAPVGTGARLAYRPSGIFYANGEYRFGCNGTFVPGHGSKPFPCGLDHDSVTAEPIRIDVGVRSI
jgi:hypothetical protein